MTVGTVVILTGVGDVALMHAPSKMITSSMAISPIVLVPLSPSKRICEQLYFRLISEFLEQHN